MTPDQMLLFGGLAGLLLLALGFQCGRSSTLLEHINWLRDEAAAAKDSQQWLTRELLQLLQREQQTTTQLDPKEWFDQLALHLDTVGEEDEDEMALQDAQSEIDEDQFDDEFEEDEERELVTRKAEDNGR